MNKHVKIIIAAAVCLAMLLCSAAFPSGAFISESETAPRVGDADGDGAVNAKDTFAVKLLLTGKEVSYLLAGADACADGIINSKDTFYIRRHITEAAVLEPGGEDYPVGRIVIGNAEIGDFEISVSADATKNMLYAAEELQKYIKRARGCELPVVTDSTADNRIVLALDKTGELGIEGVDISVENNCVFITGGTLRGCMYGVYEFLEKYIGWVFINAENEYVNKNGSVEILNGSDYRHIPTIRDRDSQTWSYQFNYSNSTFLLEGALRLKISSRKNRGALERNEKYGFSEGYVGTAHTMAEYYPKIDNTTQACYCNSAIYDEVLENVLAKIKRTLEKGDPCERVSVSPMDNTNYCQCRNCRKVYEREKSYMGPQLDFINRLADDVSKVYPDVHIMTTAYWNARKPPLNIVPRDNVDILYCWGGCNNHPMDGSECYEEGNYMWSNNIRESGFFEKWCEITGTVYCWIYATSYSAMLAQPSLVQNIREDIRYLADCGVYGVYCEGYSGTPDIYKDGNCFDLLTMYMFARCMWDPYMTEDEFNDYENEFLRYYYGDGWELVREYIDMNAEAGNKVEKCWANNCDIVFDTLNFDYYKENSEYMIGLIDKALTMTKTESETDHLEHLAASVYWMCLCTTYESEYENGTEASRAKYAERYERLYGWMIKYPIVNLDGLTDGFDPQTDSQPANPYKWCGWPEGFYHKTRLAKDPLEAYQ